MKIMFVSNASWTLFNYRLSLMRSLKSKGYDIVAVAPDDKYAKGISREFEFIPLNNLDRKSKNPIKDLKLFFVLYGIYKSAKPVLVLHYTVKPNIYGSLACRFLGIKSVASFLGLGYVFINNSVLTIFLKSILRFSLKYSAKVIFMNRDDLRLFKENKILKENGVVIPEGIDFSFFDSSSAGETADAAINLPAIESRGGGVRFLLIGRMLMDKGIQEFVAASKIVNQKYPDSYFELLGPLDSDNPSGISKQILQKWEEESSVKYLGETNDVRPYIARSNVIVLPSYREGSPRVLLEAMAMEKPIIATDSPGCRDIVEDGKNGFLVPIKDSRSLAAAMIKMIDMGSEKRSELGRHGKEKAKREYDDKIIIQSHLNLIADVLQTNI